MHTEVALLHSVYFELAPKNETTPGRFGNYFITFTSWGIGQMELLFTPVVLEQCAAKYVLVLRQILLIMFKGWESKSLIFGDYTFV